MHFLLFLLLLTPFFINVSEAQVRGRDLGIADIPPCGLTCLLETIPAAGCGLSDTECQCESEELTYSTAACILANCTMADSLGIAKVQAELCNLPHESRSGMLLASLTTIYATVCLFVALRFATRILTKRIRADDWVILAALLLSTATYASAYEMVQQNFGKHLWDLESGQLREALRYFYICWNLYVITLGLVKVSLIAFYLQVFCDRRFRIVCYVVLGCIAISTLIIQCLTIFACTPVHSFWDRDIKGKCLDIGAVGFANSANAILQDLIILVLPMPSLFKLQMNKWRKVAVALMFAVGAFGCITTIIRLHVLSSFRISLDPTWDYIDVVIWTGAELAAGIVCASLPAVRQLLALLLPKQWSSFLTYRSRSRSLPMPGRDHLPSANKKLQSSPSHGKGSYGGTTEISPSKWTKAQAEHVEDIERGCVPRDQSKSESWLPLRALFSHPSRSMKNSMWSSRGCPPSSHRRPPHPQHIKGFQALSSQSASADTSGKASVEDQVELLQVPEYTYWVNGHNSAEEEVTALPRASRWPMNGPSQIGLSHERRRGWWI